MINRSISQFHYIWLFPTHSAKQDTPNSIPIVCVKKEILLTKIQDTNYLSFHHHLFDLKINLISQNSHSAKPNWTKQKSFTDKTNTLKHNFYFFDVGVTSRLFSRIFYPNPQINSTNTLSDADSTKYIYFQSIISVFSKNIFLRGNEWSINNFELGKK